MRRCRSSERVEGTIRSLSPLAMSVGWVSFDKSDGAERHIYKRYPLTYHPAYWGLVFPMGMYTVCTFRLAKVMKLDFLLVIPKFFIYLALIAWAATIFGLARQLITTFIKTEAVEQINKKITKDAGKI